MDTAQCLQGFRILNTLSKLGVNENQFDRIILEAYEYCQRQRLTLDNIACNLKATQRSIILWPLPSLQSKFESVRLEQKVGILIQKLDPDNAKKLLVELEKKYHTNDRARIQQQYNVKQIRELIEINGLNYS